MQALLMRGRSIRWFDLAGALAFVAVPSVAHADVFESVADGRWSAPATWHKVGSTGNPDGEVPGVGDTVTVRHLIWIEADTVVGHSPYGDDPVAAIAMHGGELILDRDRQLVVRGDLRLHPGVVTMLPGSAIELDSSQSQDPPASVYRIDIRPDEGTANALLSVDCEPEHRCEVRSNPLGAHGRITDGNGRGNGGRVVARGGDFIGLGGAPDYSAWMYNPTGSGDPFEVVDSRFERCSQVRARQTIPRGGHVVFERTAWSNSVANPEGDDYWEIHRTGAEPGATVELRECYFDARVYLESPNDYVIEDCVFASGVKGYTGEWRNGPIRSFRRNFVRWREAGAEWTFTFGTTIEDSVFVKDVETGNPHYALINGGTGPLTMRGNVMWFTGTQPNEGDTWILGFADEGTRDDNIVTLERNLYLPNALGPKGPPGNISGTGFTVLSDTPGELGRKQIIFRRNTVFSGSAVGGCNVGETERTFAGAVSYFKSNLFVGVQTANGPVGRKLQNLGHSDADVVLASAADYNGSHRMEPGSNFDGPGTGKGYDRLEFSGDTKIGAHDIDDTDPAFFDPTRTPVTWDATLGGPGTLDGTMRRLAPGGGHSILELLEYLRAGFRPNNTAFLAAGDPLDGSPDIGAVDMEVGLTAPAELRARVASDNTVALTWQDRSVDEARFVVQRGRTSSPDDFEPREVLGPDSRAFVDRDVVPGVRYFYRVFAERDDERSPFSNLVSAVAGGGDDDETGEESSTESGSDTGTTGDESSGGDATGETSDAGDDATDSLDSTDSSASESSSESQTESESTSAGEGSETSNASASAEETLGSGSEEGAGSSSDNSQDTGGASSSDGTSGAQAEDSAAKTPNPSQSGSTSGSDPTDAGCRAVGLDPRSILRFMLGARRVAADVADR